MRFETSALAAWREAEQRAAAAEQKLFAKVLSPDPGSVPTREEVEEALALRQAATTQMQQMLNDMRDLAAALRGSRVQARPATNAALRSGRFARSAKP